MFVRFEVAICAAVIAVPGAMLGQQERNFTLVPGLDHTIMDTTADPCQDFYQYACGKWVNEHPLPKDSSSTDQVYNLQQYTTQVLHRLLEDAAAAHAKQGTDIQKIGDLYASCMDEKTIEAKGILVLKPDLERIEALSSKEELPALLGDFQLKYINAFAGFGKMQDYKDAQHNVAMVGQAGLGLPERDYYFRTAAKDVEIRTKYVERIANTLKLLGELDAQAKSEAAAIMKLETTLAKASLDATTVRDPHATYHWKTVAELQEMTP